ncbi:cation:proton antiporter [Nocardioides sp. zg-536]|uniref:Cation:proton antiporter n=1 Tax=Nocardioides faecalis TaxID=2803858 RepID=A0A938Y3G4_9ACTN|nr:cation:proton antiporter [Nocardioides faecalis]MBM9461507.1 cation:proton antiporter [Nocardioides faecalis]QVI57863.1 cation:proton antiporter [Nocardioides faecalis]
MLDITVILGQLALIIVVARLAGLAAGRIGIPPVVGEIFAGVLLGPSLLGEGVSDFLFPADTLPFLKLLADMGLVLFMFVVGLELDVSLVRGRGRVAASVSVLSIALPFTMGLGLALLLRDLRADGADLLPYALFLGAAMSITAFPVLARILADRRMNRTETGGLALACAATDDVLAWTMLAVVIGIAGGEGHGHGPSWVIYLALPFALFAILVVRPVLTRLTTMYRRAGELTPTILSIVLVGILLFSAATEYLGVHFIFGAFLFGAIMPHAEAAALRHEILVRLEQLSVLLLLPVFFLVAGLAVDVRGLSAENLLQLAAILAVAIAGKYVGAYLGARSAGVPHWQANALGILMNTRGLTELVILSVGRELGLLSDELFTMMVIMALVTTVMTGPLLNLAYPRRRVARDIAEAERAALGEQAVDRVLVLTGRGRGGGDGRDGGDGGDGGDERDDRVLLDLAVAALGGARPAEIVVAELTPQGRPLEVGSGLSLDLTEMAAAMERQQVLVRRGEELGVPVRVIAHPSADVAQDLVELVGVLAPQGLLAWSDDPALVAVGAATEAPVVLVAPGTPSPEPGAAVVVHASSDADGEAALLLGARLATARGAVLELHGEGRRMSTAGAALAARGVRLADGVLGSVERAGALAPAPVEVAGLRRAGTALRVRAELDAAPIDFATVPLGAAEVPAR